LREKTFYRIIKVNHVEVWIFHATEKKGCISMSFEQLQDKICAMQNPTVAGLDARLSYVPAFIVERCKQEYGTTRKAAAEAIYTFNCGLIDSLCDVVPAVKPQAAYYELLGWEGMEMMERTIRYAKSKGMYVIADIKRGDIGSTASAYAEGWLGKSDLGGLLTPCFDADCVTTNGYMGIDAIKPFLKVANEEDKTLFVLVRTSNPSAVDLQDRMIGEEHIYDVMGHLVAQWGEGFQDRYGYNRVGAVVGATWPEQLTSLRKAMPHTFFLVPGYGAQGGTAEDVKHAFDADGHGAIVNSSRGIMCAWQKTGKNGEDYMEAARNAAIAMRDAITAITPIR
jgi:orotidine-5'-phosphate decarboxylase